MKIRPVSITVSIWYFIISSAVIYLGLYTLLPILLSRGLPFFTLYLIFFHIPLFLLIIVSLLAYKVEGNKWNLNEFSSRMQLRKMSGTDWLWALGLFVLGIIAYLGLAPVGAKLAQYSFLSPPEFFPAEINPNRQPAPGHMMDYKLSGQYWLIFTYFFAWVTNILGEELLFRGIIFPRQQERYSRLSWIYHAIIWALWHFFFKWNLLSIFPFSFALSYTIYKRRNLWTTIIAHGMMNSIPLILIIIEVLK